LKSDLAKTIYGVAPKQHINMSELSEFTANANIAELNADSVELIDGVIGQPGAVYRLFWQNAPADFPHILYTDSVCLEDCAGWTDEGFYPAVYSVFRQNPELGSVWSSLGLPFALYSSAVELIHGTAMLKGPRAVYRVLY
jgi:hypothetical protein